MKDLEGKYVIGFDTICDGNQTGGDESGEPTLYDSEADAFFELFGDAIAGLDGTNDEYFEDNALDKEKIIAEMKALLEEGDNEKMKNFFDVNPECNYYDEFVEKADEFTLGRKAIFNGDGVVIEGTKLKDL